MKAYAKKSLRSLGALVGAGTLALGMSVSPATQAQEPFIAEIVMFGGNFAPRGWALCDGQILSISQNTALFSLLGTTYGGNGESNFALPDLRGRSAVHPGTGPGLTRILLGEKGGRENVTLTGNELPSHTHTATASATLHANSGAGNSAAPGDHSLAMKSRTKIYSSTAPNVTMQAGSVTVDSVTVDATGSNQAFNIRNPYLGVNHIIALVGTYPSPN